MNLLYYITSFGNNLITIDTLYTSIDSKQIKWKPAPGKWNMLEIICHLYDEEKFDFRARLKSVLENPSTPFEPIDPPGWVKLHKYEEQDFITMLTSFAEERKKTIAWLNTLQNVNWENTYHHPKIGPMSAKYIIANWLAHDYLHIRQILKLKYDYLKFSSEQNLSYAGDW